mgnify:FL=1
MKRKVTVIAIIALIFSIIFSITVSANTNDIKNAAGSATNFVRNAIGGAENVMEDAAKGTAGAIKNGTNAIENGGERIGNDVQNGVTDVKDSMNSNNTNTMSGSMSNQNDSDKMGRTNNNYTATRTATTSDVAFLGISNTVWTWLIIGITAIAIISLIVFYMRQNKTTNLLIKFYSIRYYSYFQEPPDLYIKPLTSPGICFTCSNSCPSVLVQ